MADLFHSARYSVEHAKRHIQNLDGSASAFFNDKPYAAVSDLNEDGSKYLHKIKLVKPVPAALNGIAFDAINNLRSALDQAGYAIGVANSTRGKHAHFPFGDTAAEVETRRTKQSRDLPKEIFDYMASCKPYIGGNDTLWAMNKICNSHKHEIIIPVAIGSGVMRTVATRLVGIDTLMYPEWDATKNEMVVMIGALDAPVNANFDIASAIVFTQPTVLSNRIAGEVLAEMASLTESIINGIEAEGRSLGLCA